MDSSTQIEEALPAVLLSRALSPWRTRPRLTLHLPERALGALVAGKDELAARPFSLPGACPGARAAVDTVVLYSTGGREIGLASAYGETFALSSPTLVVYSGSSNAIAFTVSLQWSAHCEGAFMATEEITLRVSPAAAEIYRKATPQERLKLEALVSLQLLNQLQPKRSLDEVIADMSQQAQQRGLTPELLEELLRDDC